MADLSQAYQGLVSVSDDWCGISGLTQCPNCHQLLNVTDTLSGHNQNMCPYCKTGLNLKKTTTTSVVDTNFQSSLINMANRWSGR
jgi:hypothetical protein